MLIYILTEVLKIPISFHIFPTFDTFIIFDDIHSNKGNDKSNFTSK